jgi:6-phosphogluconate dehydrogenase (decarboxylating)
LARFRSPQPHTFAETILPATRFTFGGHAEPTREKSE